MVEPSASQKKFLPSPPCTKHWEMPCSHKYSSHILGGQQRSHLEQTDLPDTAMRRSLASSGKAEFGQGEVLVGMEIQLKSKT